MTSEKLSYRHRVITMLLSTVLVLSISTMLIQKTTAQTTRYITISSFAFQPQYPIVYLGDTVVWTNDDPVIHTLWFTRVSDGSTYLLSDPISPAATWSHTFDDTVNLQYYDMNRLWITGFLNIVPAVPAVGGVYVSVDKFGLLAPYIGLASTTIIAAVATAIYVQRVKRRKEKQ